MYIEVFEMFELYCFYSLMLWYFKRLFCIELIMTVRSLFESLLIIHQPRQPNVGEIHLVISFHAIFKSPYV